MTIGLSEPFPVRRERALNLWASGSTARQIADAIGETDEGWVRHVVSRARLKGDARATKRGSGFVRTRPVPEPMAPILPAGEQPIRVVPSWEGMTLVGILMGDPQRGRSALDQKRAAANG